jgi:protein gp37
MGTRGYEGVVDKDGWTGRVNFVESVLAQITPKQKPKTIFMGSMSDLFHKNVRDDERDEILDCMKRCRQHSFIILTKRIDNAYDYLRHARELPNVQLLVSIWDQASADAAIPVLIDTPAAVRGVSIEPMLGPMIIKNIERLDRVILGGENGPGARPTHPDWVRSVRDQCVDADVPFWFKGFGAWIETGEHTRNELWGTLDRQGNWYPRITRWKEGEVVVTRVGRKNSGHLLDGREWRQTPERKG